MPRPERMKNFPRRKSLRLPEYEYSSAGAYFITLCCNNRRCLFGDNIDAQVRLNPLGEICGEAWREIPDHFSAVELDEYVIMPNHLHGILLIKDERARHASPLQPQGNDLPKLGHVVASFKSVVSRRIRRLPGSAELKIWQRNYYEHVIRNNVSLNEIRTYIANNPPNWAEDQLNPAYIS